MRQVFVFAGLVFAWGVLPLAAGSPEVPAARLAPLLQPRAEVGFVRFLDSGALLIGGVTPYGDRAGQADTASRLTWDDRSAANWVEWDPSGGALVRGPRDVSAREVARQRKAQLAPVFPADWVRGEHGRGKVSREGLVALGAALDTLAPGSSRVEVHGVSPRGDFAVVTAYESADDGLGQLVFLRRDGSKWSRVGRDGGDLFPNEIVFSPDGDWMACRAQPNGYDGPEPWLVMDTRTGRVVLPAAGSKRLIYALAVRGASVAAGWSDGSVSVLSLGSAGPR